MKNLDKNFGEFPSRFVVNCDPVSDLGALLKMKKNFHLHMAVKFFWDRILKNGARRSEYMYKTLLSSKGLVWNLIERAKVLQTSYLAIPPQISRFWNPILYIENPSLSLISNNFMMEPRMIMIFALVYWWILSIVFKLNYGIPKHRDLKEYGQVRHLKYFSAFY